jgi:hypothetical protein
MQPGQQITVQLRQQIIVEPGQKIIVEPGQMIKVEPRQKIILEPGQKIIMEPGQKIIVPHRRADWSQDRRYQALSSWGSGEQGRVGQWVEREGQMGSVYN